MHQLFKSLSYKDYILTFLWFAFWLSIGATPEIKEIRSPLDIISLIRWTLPLFAVVPAIALMLTSHDKVSVPFWVVLLGMSFSIIAVSSVANDVDYSKIYYPLASLSALVLLVACITCVPNARKRFIIVFLPGAVMIFGVVVFFTAETILTGSEFGVFAGYMIGSNFKQPFLGEAAPLPTGLARSSFLLIPIFLYAYWNNLLEATATSFLGGICLALITYFQSRGVFLAAFMSLSLFAYLQPQCLKPDKKHLLIFFVAFGCALFSLYYSAYFAHHWLFPSGDQTAPKPLQHFRDFTPTSFSSGRIENWLTAAGYILQKPLLGWGSQADRVLVGQNISNLPLYSLLCGGLAAFLPLLVLGGIFLKKIYHKFKSTMQWSAEEKYSVLVIFFISFRGMTENSFAVYSIDYLIILPAFTVFFESAKKYTSLWIKS